MHTVSTLITRYGLQPHPEGGYYKETYRSAECIDQTALPDRFTGKRCFCTGIYFLLQAGDFSAFHRIKSDECWHFYAGQTLWIHILHPDGKWETIHLGNQWENGETFQYTVPAGCWFASEPAPHSTFSLVGCTVAPGLILKILKWQKAENWYQIIRNIKKKYYVYAEFEKKFKLLKTKYYITFLFF